MRNRFIVESGSTGNVGGRDLAALAVSLSLWFVSVKMSSFASFSNSDAPVAGLGDRGTSGRVLLLRGVSFKGIARLEGGILAKALSVFSFCLRFSVCCISFCSNCGL